MSMVDNQGQGMAALKKWLLADVKINISVASLLKALYVLAFDWYLDGDAVIVVYILNIDVTLWLCPREK